MAKNARMDQFQLDATAINQDAQSAIVLSAHGSCDPSWRSSFDDIEQRMRSGAPRLTIRSAFLEWNSATLDEAISSMREQSVRIVPMFLGIGKHMRENLPSMLAHLRQIYPDELVVSMGPVLGR